jgi:uncharacterized cupredoxin-like copper-binding protein
MKCRVKTITAGRQRLISGARFAGAVLAIAMLLLLVLLSVACGGAATPAPTGETVVVELKEWSVTPDKSSVAAGRVTFEAKNVGTIPHELVVLKTALPADALVVEESVVNEDASGELIGEIEEDELAAGQSSSTSFDLTPGKYVLFCNIPAHYQSGMFVAFEVK